MSQADVDLLFQRARSALESGEDFPAEFLIPVGEGRWRVISHDLVASGENDFGIPPKTFAHAAVGMLVAALAARECYSAEAVEAPRPARPALDPMGGNAFQQALVVTRFAKGRLEVHVQPYGRSASGEWLWGEPTVRTRTEPGPLGAALPLWRAVNREPSPLPPPEELIGDMVDSGFEVSLEE